MKNKLQRFWLRFHDRFLKEKKLKFAYWWDKKYPGKYCWADCVTWAIASQRLNPFKIDNSNACKIESTDERCPFCYCGGWNNGVCFALLPKEEQDRIAAENKFNYELEPELPF